MTITIICGILLAIAIFCLARLFIVSWGLLALVIGQRDVTFDVGILDIVFSVCIGALYVLMRV